MINCILLDFDDTIYTFSDAIKHALFSMIRVLKLDREQSKKVLQGISTHFEKVFSPINNKTCADEFQVDSLFLEKAFDYYNTFSKVVEEQIGQKNIISKEQYYTWFLSKCKVLPTVRDALCLFKEHGFLVGLLSDGLRQDKITILDHLCLKSFFDIIVSSQDTFCVKPGIAFISYVEDKLGISRQDCVYVGNHISDYTLAKKAGMSFFAFNPDARLLEYMQNNNMQCLKRLLDLEVFI